MALTIHPPSSAEVIERVEVYLYSTSGSSWPVIGLSLPFTFTFTYKYGTMKIKGRWNELMFNVQNTTFCAHNVFMYLVCMSEETAIISSCSIGWMAFITQNERVYCTERTLSLNIILLVFFG